MSQDAVAVVTLLGSFFTFWLLAGSIGEELAGFMGFCFSKVDLAGGLVIGDILNELVMQALGLMIRSVLPITLVTAGCAIAATFAQTKLLVRDRKSVV